MFRNTSSQLVPIDLVAELFFLELGLDIAGFLLRADRRLLSCKGVIVLAMKSLKTCEQDTEGYFQFRRL